MDTKRLIRHIELSYKNWDDVCWEQSKKPKTKQLIEHLLKTNPQSMYEPDKSGDEPWQHAVKTKDPGLIVLFIKYGLGADTISEEIDAMCNSFDTNTYSIYESQTLLRKVFFRISESFEQSAKRISNKFVSSEEKERNKDFIQKLYNAAKTFKEEYTNNIDEYRQNDYSSYQEYDDPLDAYNDDTYTPEDAQLQEMRETDRLIGRTFSHISETRRKIFEPDGVRKISRKKGLPSATPQNTKV